jgi:hypothetical protein
MTGELRMASQLDTTEIFYVFQEWLPKLEEKTSHNYSTVINEVLLWAKPNSSLIKTIFQLIYGAELPSPIKDEALYLYIKVLVQHHIIDNWEEKEAAQPLREMRDNLLNNQQCDSFSLLMRYRQIWRYPGIKEDGSREEEKLVSLNLVDNTDGYLRVCNLIYQSVFDQSWIDLMLARDSRPYVKELIAWLDANKDSSKLLVGESFQKAKEWFDNNKQSLTQQDRDFITLSLLKN